jgi:bacterioferritin B
MMISQRLAKLLIEQIGHELRAHQLYLGMALYFERESLNRWGKLLRDQSAEEAEHATKIMEFLTDNEVAFDLPALKMTTTRYGSATEVLKRALDNERQVSAQFDEMATAALDEGDHRSHQFLQWFIEEQLEEERKIQGLIDLVESGINLFQAEPLLDQFE